MKIYFFLILLCSLSFVARADEEAPCVKDVQEIGGEAIKLLNQIKPVVGNIPAFCRENSSPADDENDLLLKKEVEALVQKSKTDGAKKITKNQVFEVFKMVSMKKMWSTMGDKARLKTFLNNQCSYMGLNKWPIIKKYKNKKSIDDEDEEKTMNMIGLCSLQSASHNVHFLGKFLTRDVLTESFAILKEIAPEDFGFIKNETCQVFANTDETIYKKEVYKGYVLDDEELKFKKEFSEWLIGLTKKTEAKPEYSEGSSFLEKITMRFQRLKRTQSIDKIVTREEREAMHSYVGSGYIPMNKCLRTGGPCDATIQSNVNHMKSALQKLKKARGTDEEQLLFRGVRGLPKFVMENLEEGAKTGKPTEIDKAFVSTSGNAQVAMNFGHVVSYETTSDSNIIFVVKAKSCVGVDNYGEDEFICPPGIKFKVTKLKENGIYQMDEIEEK